MSRQLDPGPPRNKMSDRNFTVMFWLTAIAVIFTRAFRKRAARATPATTTHGNEIVPFAPPVERATTNDAHTVTNGKWGIAPHDFANEQPDIDLVRLFQFSDLIE